jgi:two-component system, chemotaxis family, CheB/CheR fusion protein
MTDDIGRQNAEPGEEVPGGADFTETDFRRLLDKLHLEHHFDFRDYKEASLRRRMHLRMSQVHVSTVADYIAFLDRHPSEHRALIDTILINVTRFFRDPEAWQVLRETVLPRVVEHGRAMGGLRIWSAGCSSGEEPYTIAMLLAECLGNNTEDIDIKIYGTDIDEDALLTARSGLYRLETLKDVPRNYLERYFVPEGQMYRFRREQRKWCIFGRHDLAQDPPLAHVDLLVCRNVLIYFDAELQDRILPRFCYAVRERGYLFLGRSEAMLARSPRFAPIDFKWRIFQRITTPADVRLPIESAVAQAGSRHARMESDTTVRLGGIVDALPFGVMVIDPSDTILTWNAGSETLYEIPADNAIGKKFRELDISYRIEGLRSRIEEVKASHTRVRMPDVTFPRRTGEVVHVTIVVSALYDERRRLSGVLVVGEDVTDYARLREEMNRLSEQSTTANEELQSTNEELETTNEELQSTNEELETTNEELQSTNEELETTVEELQSMNAELAKMNTELERRTLELNEADAFHQSIMNAMDRAAVVLDPNLRVRTWNRNAAYMWGLRTEDAVNRDYLSLPIGAGPRLTREAVHRVLSTRRTESVADVPYHRDGDERKTTVVLTPLVSPQGDLIGVLALAGGNDAGADTGAKTP